MCDVQSVRLSEHLSKLYLNSEYSDVTFCVENERLPAHKLVLASREYFRALLFGYYAENQQKEIFLEVSATPFKALLRYIYNDKISLYKMDLGEIIDILRLAHMYDFNDLIAAIETHLGRRITMETVCDVFKVSQQLNLDSLREACFQLLEESPTAVLLHHNFMTLPQESLSELLKRDTFSAPEEQIFEAVLNWTKHNNVSMAQSQAIVGLVRLPLLTIDQLLNVVRPSGLVSQDILFNAINERNHADRSKHYKLFDTSNNLAAYEMGARVTLAINNRKGLLNNTYAMYASENECAAHAKTTIKSHGITVALGCVNFINHIKLLIYNRNVKYAFKYLVEVSVDKMHWDIVVDHTQHMCRSWQHLYFPSRAVRYIRCFATEFAVADLFCLVSLKAFQLPVIPQLYNGFVMPTANVATIDHGAIVLTGENSECLLDRTSMISSGDSGRNEYTSHQFGDGEIVIQLGQPYYIGSIRLLLWDPENRKYQFYVQTSVDNINWTMAVDMRNNDMLYAPVLKFAHRVVLYVKIIGTDCSIKEDKEFRCVRLECPSNPTVKLTAIDRKAPDTVERNNRKRKLEL